MGTLLILYVTSALALIALSVPLLVRLVPPNPIYGFRLAPVFDSDRIWYETNHYAARWLLAGGVSTLLAAISLYFVPGLSVDAYAIACLASLVVILVPGVILSLKYARRMAAETK